jgi:hypothetical protein
MGRDRYRHRERDKGMVYCVSCLYGNIKRDAEIVYNGMSLCLSCAAAIEAGSIKPENDPRFIRQALKTLAR